MKITPPLSDKEKIIQQKVKRDNFPIVAIGASAGGLAAMTVLLKNIPPNTGMAFIYVQHLSPTYKSLLTPILSKLTQMKVHEIEDMEVILPNNVYVIPPNKKIEVVDGHIHILSRTKGPASSFSIDLLFKSLAQTHKENVIGIILSGYASDGVKGLKAIKDAGGKTFAQDDSAQADSMPKLAIATGAVDFVLSPKEIALELVRLSKANTPKEKEITVLQSNENYYLNTIFKLLLKKTGVDFTHYKSPTIKRRIQHNMQQSGINSIKDFVTVLMENENFVESLYGDLLINVTSFFREKSTFDYLKTSIFPKILQSKSPGESLRIWVTACSTGQEAYSLAMILTDLQDMESIKVPIQIFASDLSEQAIREARLGEYTSEDVKMIPENYLNRFFIKSGNTYRIVKEIREICVFATHNILRDPPFSRMDFVSCCNLLIYFDSFAQKKVFSTFHYALKDGGYLMLGRAETIGTSSQLFSRINNEYKIYLRKKIIGKPKITELTPHFTRLNMSSKKIITTTKSIISNPLGIEDAVDSFLLSSYMPACVVVNKDMEIIQFKGPISPFLEHPSGKASLNILKMARPEFAYELRVAIEKVLKTKEPAEKSGIELKIDTEIKIVSFEISPVKVDWDEPLLLVVFKIIGQVELVVDSEKGAKDKTSQKDLKLKNLTEELNNIRAEVIANAEAQEIVYEELQAANEEIVSSNEELQSLNEELETSKEEIEATNEELITTNLELQIRNDLLTESQQYSDAIFATIHEPLIILDANFNVKSANKSFYKTFQVEKEEIAGKLFFELTNNLWDIPVLREKLKSVLNQGDSFENFEVTPFIASDIEKIILLNARLIEQKVTKEQLILLAIEDITERSKFYIQEKYARSLIEASLDPLITINSDGKITDMNKATVELTGVSFEKMKGTDFFYYFTEQKNASEIHKEIFSKGIVTNYPLTILHKNGQLTDVLFNGSVYTNDKGNVQGAVILARDVTEQKRNQRELVEAKLVAEMAANNAEVAKYKAEDAVKAKQQFLSNMSHEIRTPMNAIIGFTGVMMKTELTPKQKEFLSAIKTSGDTLIVLINDILDLAKVDAGKMIFEHNPFKMSDSIASALKVFETKIQEKNLQLRISYDKDIPKVLIGDSIRLHQILLNLLSNAVKFTLDGEISVNIDLLAEDNESVKIQFTISDTGIGIDATMIDAVFNDFQQANSGTSRMYGGTGLGLSIVKQLVHALGGAISVKSELNKGSIFTFELSFPKSTTNIIIENDAKEINNKVIKIKVLVIEDVILNQLFIKTLLDDFGIEYDIVSDGNTGIEKLKKISYDLVLLDIQMPIMDGFEVAQIIRNKLKLSIPIIALTADVTNTNLEKCIAAGMNEYISKPIDENLLFSKIIHLVEKNGKNHTNHNTSLKFTDLTKLRNKTKLNPTLMTEILVLYLNDVPQLIKTIKDSMKNKDWKTLQNAAHRLIPTFSIIGMNEKYEELTRKIHDFNGENGNPDEINKLILKIETACLKASEEIKLEINKMKLE
jgi:two-component system CheB/CheR fusion protein